MGGTCSPETDNQTHESNMDRVRSTSTNKEEDMGMPTVTPDQIKAMTDQIIELSGRTAHLEQQLEEERTRCVRLEEANSQLQSEKRNDNTSNNNTPCFDDKICQELGFLFFKHFLTKEEKSIRNNIEQEELSAMVLSDLVIDKFDLKGV
ncbi:hypothetical protein RFI_16501, partial [Reticulomyxa filosa]